MALRNLVMGALATGLVVWSANAAAADSCLGTVSQLDVKADGRVYVSIDGTGVDINLARICNVVSKEGDTEAEACQMMVKLLTGALLSGNPVRAYFDSLSACTNSNYSDESTNFYQIRLGKN